MLTPEMRAIIWAQLNPVKSMKQVINDRNLYRLLLMTALIIACCQ